MTQLRPPRADQSRPGQHRAGLTALAGATFVYVTAETLPIGLVPQLSAGLHVRPGTVGLLVTVNAAVAGLSAVPLTAALEHRSRRATARPAWPVSGWSAGPPTGGPAPPQRRAPWVWW